MAAACEPVEDEDVALAAKDLHILHAFGTSRDEEVIAAMALGTPDRVACG